MRTVKTITSTNGFKIIIDDCDYTKLNQYSWWVRLKNGKPIIGYFGSAIEAAKAYDVRKYHGDFAITNFKDGAA